MIKEVKSSSDKLKKIVDNMGRVIIGKEETIKLVVLSLISGGHVLLEDIPGVGKTSLVSALAKSVSCDFSRIQFTPDILPSDISGFSMYNQKTGDFEFKPGAAMSNFVLADEINRASAKSQASLLEIMEEKQVTVDGKTYELEEPFMVLATQNPVDSLGTYQLPEAQMDRFQIRVSLGYPSIEEEMKIISMTNKEKKSISPVVKGEDIIKIKELVPDIKVDEKIKKYIMEIVSNTRNSKDLTLGASPRGSISLYRMGQALAIYEGRDYVIPDDIKFLAQSVLAHRLILSNEAKIGGKTDKEVVGEILEKSRVL